jgi:hypothetical protein
MKKTEWFYESNTQKWWMVTVSTNAKHIPTIKLGDTKRQKNAPVSVKGINLYSQNKMLLYVILGLVGVLGASLGLIAILLVS